MKLPRAVNGASLAKSFRRLGYQVTRQTGSHIRLTCNAPSQHHITIPNHDPIRAGTLSAILVDVALHLKVSKEDLIRQLFE